MVLYVDTVCIVCVKSVLAIVVGHSIAGVTLTLETGDSVGV